MNFYMLKALRRRQRVRQILEKRDRLELKWMRNLIVILSLIAVITFLSACSIGPKCTYTQEGTKIKSWFWFYKDKPADLDKMNCN